MALQWDESLAPGFEEIGSQHRSIFEQYEKLSEAVRHGTAAEIIEELASFLFEFTQMHFPCDDNTMVEYTYPKIEVPRFGHEEFTREVNQLKKRIEHEGATREVAIVVTGKLLMWILQNITRKHDKEMVAYVKNCIALKQKYEN
jgi:hemerythrin-like metal-binding protein